MRLTVLLFVTVLLLNTETLQATDDFSTSVRPLLSNACFQCHGPDADSRAADLRLDMKEGLFRSEDGQAIVKAGDPSNSELIRRVLSDDPDEVMPPPDSNKSLSEEEKQTLVEWVKAGASWQEHWAFVPPSLPAVPEQNGDWPLNEIDGFVQKRLHAAKLSPSASASPEALVRRLYLDLIGLPPTPDQADRWIQRIWPDGSDVVVEKEYQALVTELLASPHYGERWARRWLDLARYADTNGYEKDRERTVWPYRDWVVNAINSGMSFRQFTIEQLAGDMLPNASIDQKIATGFHRNTMLNEEGGIDPLEFRYHAMTDRVATTGTTWLGLTLGCCQCHTHKYDPVSHHEYFGIMAYLNNADEPTLEIPDEKLTEQWASRRSEAEQLLLSLAEKWPKADANGKPVKSIESAFAAWRESEKPHAVAWTTLIPTAAKANLPLLTIESDHAIFASGDTAKRDDYYVTLAPSDHPVTALRLETLPDERLPARGPGTTYYEGTIGDFYLTEIHVQVGEEKIPFVSATETFAKNRYGKNPAFARQAIDGDIQTGWSVHGRQGERHVAVFVPERPIPAGVEINIHMSFGRHFASSLGRFRFSGTAAKDAPAARTYSSTVAKQIREGADSNNPESEVFQAFLIEAPELAEPAKKIRELLKRPAAQTALVMSERPANNPRPTFRHHRGEYTQPRDRVHVQIPEALRAGDHLPQNRLEFAEWLVSGNNPLTARVVVNRHWAAIFGTGLVKTVDDFGLQGESPSHPDLLDWLAVKFSTDDEWSVQKLHRRIVSSATYRQQSVFNQKSLEVDPDNRLLSYSPRYRLDAEILRDQFLVAAQVLNRKQGGPPVRPPQPKGVTEVAYGNSKWNPSSGDDRFRRSLYTFMKRTAPFAMFTTFDAPSGESCIARRNRSNSPLQALTLLNDNMLIEIAQQAGSKAFETETLTSTSDAASDLFRRTLVRSPSQQERHSIQTFLAQQKRYFDANAKEAAELLNRKAEEGNVASIAAWTTVARAVFSLDETLTRP